MATRTLAKRSCLEKISKDSKILTLYFNRADCIIFFTVFFSFRCNEILWFQSSGLETSRVIHETTCMNTVRLINICIII